MLGRALRLLTLPIRQAAGMVHELVDLWRDARAACNPEYRDPRLRR